MRLVSYVIVAAVFFAQFTTTAFAQGTHAASPQAAAPAQPPQLAGAPVSPRPAATNVPEVGAVAAPANAAAPVAPPAGTGITLAEIVRIAIGNNTGLSAASLRLKKAQELIAQVNGQGKPQLRLDAADYATSYNAVIPSLPTLAVQNPIVPGGGVIPVITDVAGGFSSAFVGAPNGGSSSGIVVTPGTTTSSNAGLPLGAPVQSMPENGGIAAPGASSPSGATPSGSPTQNASATPGGAPGAGAPASGAGQSGSSKASTAPKVAEAALPILLAPLLADSLSGNGDADEETGVMGSVAQNADKQDQPHSSEPVSDAATGSNTATADPSHNNYAARVAIIQYLDVFGLLPQARDSVKNVMDFYSLDLDRLQNETALAAKNLFFNALFAGEEVQNQQEQVKYATENVRIAQSRFKYGQVSQLDVLTAQTALAAAQQRYTAAQNQQNLAQSSLNYLLGYDMGTPLNLVDPALPPLDATVDVKQSTAGAIANRPEVRQAQATIDEAKHLEKIANAGTLPAIGLVASAEQGGARSSTLPDESASIGAIVEWPLDDGGVTRSRIRSAKLDIQTQQLALEQVQLAVGLEIQQAAYNISNAQTQVSSAQTALSQAQEAVRIANERYVAGLGTFLDVLNALAELSVARTNLSVSQYLYETSLAQLVRSMGGR